MSPQSVDASLSKLEQSDICFRLAADMQEYLFMMAALEGEYEDLKPGDLNMDGSLGRAQKNKFDYNGDGMEREMPGAKDAIKASISMYKKAHGLAKRTKKEKLMPDDDYDELKKTNGKSLAQLHPNQGALVRPQPKNVRAREEPTEEEQRAAVKRRIHESPANQWMINFLREPIPMPMSMQLEPSDELMASGAVLDDDDFGLVHANRKGASSVPS